MPYCSAMRIWPSAWAARLPSSRVKPVASAAALRAMRFMKMLSVDSVREVADHGRAIELPAQVIGRAGGEMHQRSVVPEHHVVRLPAVAVDELGLHAVREKLGKQCVALGFRQAHDAGREMLAHEQRLAAGFGMRA